MKRIERALVSVYDKSGIVEFCRGLTALGVEIVATGSTGRFLADNGVAVREVSEFTGFPEILDGRVKTLNPRIAGGLLAVRSNADHMRQIREHDIPLIDLVCVNLYPFVETLKKPGVTHEEIIENIDIGGPSMIRAAAKNYEHVTVITSPEDYGPVLSELRQNDGLQSLELRREMARKAYVCTARYDGQISQYFSRDSNGPFPGNLFMDFEKVHDLRYGENPHQKAALYQWGGQPVTGFAASRQLQGKELSFNNLVDLDAAWNLVREFPDPACCIIKHTNPCGAAAAGDVREAFVKALAADPVSAFGSIVGFNRIVDEAAAIEMADLFVEAIAAPGYSDEALARLSKKKSCRVLAMTDQEGSQWARYESKRVAGGIVLQETDTARLAADLQVVTSRAPSAAEMQDLLFAWNVVKHVRSNAIVLARNRCTVGVGAGQMSRVDSVRISVQKGGQTSNGAVLASEALFPFRDNIDEAGRAGITAIIQPGGSLRDQEVIDAANEHGIAMIFTGLRHFKH